MEDINQIQRFQFNDVDGNVAASTLLSITNGNTIYGRFIVQSVCIIPKTITPTGDTQVPPIINIGTNSTAYDNIVSTEGMPESGVNIPKTIALIDGISTIDNNTSIFIKVTSAATGYTTYKFNIYIIGFYENYVNP